VTVDTPPGGTTRIRRQATVYRSSHRWRGRLARGMVALAVAIVVVVGGLFGYAEYRYHQISHVTVGGLTSVAADQPMNILMVGNNSRCVLNGQQANAFGSCGDNGGTQVAGARSDVIMILHLDPATRSGSILSIPRDLVVPVPGFANEMKIDSSLNYGPKALVKTIENDFGISINHYVELNFDSFQGVVSALGGINMYFPDPVYDGMSGLNINPAACAAPSVPCSRVYDPQSGHYEAHVLQTGCLHLDGFQSLAEVRARHLWYYQSGQWLYDGDGDLSRIRRDHEFIRVLASEVKQRGLGNPITDNSLLSSILPQLTVDSGMGFSTMLSLVERYHVANPNTMQTYTLPVYSDPANQYYVSGQGIGSVVFPSQPFDQNAIDAWLGLSEPPASSVPASGITVQVVNASGSYGLGTTVEQQLQSAGFTVSDGGEQAPIGSPAETLVIYSPSSDPGEASQNLLNAERVAENFSGAVIMEQGATPPGVDVVVDVTSNAVFNTFTSGGPASAGYTVVSRPGPSLHQHKGESATSSVAPSTTVQPSSPTTTSPIGPATNSQNPLKPWDPRACPPGSTAVPAQFNG
jgi:anionic cell wall polymer biosynthesis LytR-Cps2A-Psr (LCP) family protein